MAGNNKSTWWQSILVWLLAGVSLAALVLYLSESNARETETRRRGALLAYASGFQNHAPAATQPGSVAQAFLDTLNPSLSRRLAPAREGQRPDRHRSIVYIYEGDSANHAGWFLILETSESGRCYLIKDGKPSRISQETTRDMIAERQNVRRYTYRNR